MRVAGLMLTGLLLCACSSQEPVPPQPETAPGPGSVWRLGAHAVGVERAGAAYQAGTREHIATDRPAPEAATEAREPPGSVVGAP
jgi:hypothetical protein